MPAYPYRAGLDQTVKSCVGWKLKPSLAYCLIFHR